VHFSVLNLRAIFFVVEHVHWHGFSISAKNRWLIHIIPELVKILLICELVIAEPRTPVILRVFVQVINPSRVTWPTVSIESSILWSSNEDIGKVAFR